MSRTKKGSFRTGTSGIVLPGTKLSFPPEFQQKTRLHYYSTLFNTVELNNTFYKVPMSSTFAKWAGEVGDDFQFTIKLWKELTHVKELKHDLTNIDIFLRAADNLRQKKGCLLVQFPGKITLDYYNELEMMLEKIASFDEENKWRIAVEFRNPGWYVSETFELLDEWGASAVLHDIPKARNYELNRNASFVYLRFHGPNGDYRGGYTDEQLAEHSDNARAWLKAGKDVYAYFNNTMGSAMENALTLKSMVGQ